MVIHDDRARRSLGDQGARRQVHHALVGRVEVVRTASIVVCIVRPQYLLSTSSGYHCQPVTFFLTLESSVIACQKRVFWTLFALQCSALRRRCGRRGGKLWKTFGLRSSSSSAESLSFLSSLGFLREMKATLRSEGACVTTCACMHCCESENFVIPKTQLQQQQSIYTAA